MSEEPIGWIVAEEELRRRLARAQARADALERDLARLRTSESFRLGHFLVRRAATLPRGARGLVAAARARSLPAGPDRPGAGGGRALFLAWGADAEALGGYAIQVERLGAILEDLAPLFVVDTVDAEPLLRRGLAVEHLIALEAWREHRPAHEWGAYVTERMAQIQRLHAPRVVVVLHGAQALDQGVLHPLLVPAVGAGDDNRV